MNIEGVVGLFPLTKLDARYIGYYINAKGEIFSTKQYAKPRLMSGSSTGGIRYYTLGIGRNRSKSEQGSMLLQRARTHADWATETSTKAVTLGVPHASDRPTAERGLEANGYVIAQVQDGVLVFGSKPKIHLTLDSVKKEVERLASTLPGTQIVYLQIKGAAVAKGIHWV